MHSTSDEYKESMKRTLRNRSYLSVNIGVINQQGQQQSYVDNRENALYLASINDIFNSKKTITRYATFEQDFVKADGGMVFPPRVAPYGIQSGFISNGLLSQGEQSIMIKFTGVDYVDVKGLTIDFGDTFPTSFYIQTNNETFTVSSNSNRLYSTNNVFEGAEYFKIVPTSMKNNNMRFRVAQLVFGVGILLGNEIIKSSTLKYHVSEVSETVPQIDFTVTVDNSAKEYNIDNTESTLNFFEIGQNFEVQYGYELDNGTIEWIKYTTLKLKSWSADNTVAKFSATDPLDLYDNTYYKGKYYDSGISLYDLAVLIFEDIGLTIDQYVIDSSLSSIIVHNPVPCIKHKEALQLIANCSLCALLIDNEARIVIGQIPTDENQYDLGTRDMTSTPVGSQLEKIRDVNVVKLYYYKNPSTAAKQIAKTTYTLKSSNNTVTMQWSNPCYDISVTSDLYTSTIIESGSYYCVVQVSGLPATDVNVAITLTGFELDSTKSTFQKYINQNGRSKIYTNPLVDNDTNANNLLEWLSDYYASDREYEISYRGDPSLQVNDIINMENDFISNLLCRIYEHTIDFNGALKGKIKARREVDV
ncbi:MAG: hypothetical protein QM644_18465 [Mobilitalea sp.]